MLSHSAKVARASRSYSVKVSSFDTGKAVSEVSLKVRAGSRYEPVPGASHLLAKYAYGNTASKSALRFVREAELLGGSISGTHDREHVTLTARFLREDLPYFVSALGSLARETLFHQYEYDETILPLAKFEAAEYARSSENVAIETAHQVAFHTGLGNGLYVGHNAIASNDQVRLFAKESYVAENVKIYGKDVIAADLEAEVAKFNLPSGSRPTPAETKFFGGEARVDKAGINTLALSFPAARSASFNALKHVLSSQPVKWGSNTGILGAIPGVQIKTLHNAYHDASLLTVLISSPNAAAVKAGALEAFSVLKKTASAGVDEATTKRALATTKLELADAVTNSHKIAEGAIPQSLDVKKELTSLLDGKIALAAVGNTRALPWLDELL